MRGPDSRLQLAKRRNQRKQALPAFVEGLRSVVGLGLDIESRLLSLEDSADYEQRLQGKFEQLRLVSALEEVKTRDISRFSEEVTRFFHQSEHELFAVFLCHWLQVGGIKLTGRELLRCHTSLLDWDGDTVLGGADDLGKVFLFDVTREESGGTRYEVAHWTATPQA